MRPFFLTETPNTFKLQFDYNPRMIDLVKRIPSHPKWDGTDRAWIVQKEDPFYPPNRDARWYVEALAQWAVNNRYCSEVKRREDAKDITYELPDKSRQYIECDITNRKEYQDAENDVIKYLRTYKNADDDKVQRAMRGQIMVQMGILKQIAARGKIHAVADFVHDVIDGGEKLILFAYLKEVVDALKQEFPDAVTVTGSDNVREKQRAVDKFQNDPECKLIILNYKSGGTGLTLTASSRVAFIEFPWTYSDCEQAEDRAHRNGQKNNVNCYYFLGSKTIDRYMYKVIQTKKDIANEVTGTTTQIDEDIVNITMNLFHDRL